MNKHVSPGALSLESWLSEKPWTFGWAAIVVFDRARTNILPFVSSQQFVQLLGTEEVK